jgi:hypothetical protein
MMASNLFHNKGGQLMGGKNKGNKEKKKPKKNG